MNILQIGLCETVYLSDHGIEPTRTERFSQPTNEVWMPQVSKKFQEICEALHPQAYYVHFCIQPIEGKNFGNVDFYNNIPEVILSRWN